MAVETMDEDDAEGRDDDSVDNGLAMATENKQNAGMVKFLEIMLSVYCRFLKSKQMDTNL